MDTRKLIDTKIAKAKEKGSDQMSDWNNFWNRTFTQRVLDLIRTYESTFYTDTILKPYFGTDKTFCELGCGTAILLKLIAKHYKKVIALDYSPDSLRIAKHVLDEARVKNYELVEQDIRDLENIKPIHDVVFSNGLIEHFKEPFAAIQSHLAYTKPGGVVIILAPYKHSSKYAWFKATDNRLLKRFWPWTEQYFFTGASMAKEMTKVQSKNIAWQKIQVLHRVENVLLIIQKRA